MAKKLALVNGIPRMVDESASPTIYDESVTLASNLSTGVNYTLPASGTYEGEEIEVYLDGQVLDSGADFNFVGAGPTRTQVVFTFDLYIGDRLRFRRIRGL
jgi:hypothetical protein